MEEKVEELKSENSAVELGIIEPAQKDIEVLNQYVESLKAKQRERIASCTRCGSTDQLRRLDKRDKSKGYICKTCLINAYRQMSMKLRGM